MCCYKINMLLFTMYLVACTRVWTVCLHLEQAFETVLEEMKLDTDILKETWALLVHGLDQIFLPLLRTNYE